MSSTQATTSPIPRLMPKLWMALLALLLIAVPLVIGQQVTASITQDVGTARDVPNIKGLEDPENGQGGLFRWGGENVVMQFQQLGYPLYAVLYIQGVRTAGLPDAVIGAKSFDKDLGNYEVPRSPITIEYKLPIDELLVINPQITITSTLFRPAGDRRQLGVVFYRIEQRNGPGPSIPALEPAAALILSGLLVFFAVVRVSRRTRWALAITALWGIGIGLLNAFERPWLVFYCLDFLVPPLVVILSYAWFAGMWRRRHEPDTPEEDVEPPTLTSNPWPLAIAITAAALLVMLWHLVAPKEPPGNDPAHNVSWGVSFYQSLPWPLQVLGIVAVLGSLAWAYFSPYNVPEPQTSSESDEDSSLKTQNSKLPPWTPWVLALAGMALFTAFPVAFSEGDSAEWDTKIPKGAIWRERELLDFYIKVRLWRILQPIFSLPSEIYQLVAVIAGGAYMAGTALVARTLGRNRTESIFLIGAMVAIGNIIFFFRYVESYATVTTVSIFVLWACWSYAEGRLSFGSVGALATLAPFVHGSALWWGPMVAVAWLLRSFQRPQATRWRAALADLWEGIGVGAAISILIASVIIIDGYDWDRLSAGMGEMGGGDGRTMMPLFQIFTRFEHYTFFSWAHVGAVINEQLLTAPLAILTLLIISALAWKGVRKVAGRVPGMVALAVGSISIFFYSITWNPDLGPRDDWDLLGLPALPLTLLAAYLLLRIPDSKAKRIAMTAYLSVSAVHTGGWLLLHVLGITY